MDIFAKFSTYNKNSERLMEHWRGGCGHWRRRLQAFLMSVSDVSGCQHIVKVVASKYHISPGMNIGGIPTVAVAMSSPTPAH